MLMGLDLMELHPCYINIGVLGMDLQVVMKLFLGNYN